MMMTMMIMIMMMGMTYMITKLNNGATTEWWSPNEKWNYYSIGAPNVKMALLQYGGPPTKKRYYCSMAAPNVK